MASEYSHDTLRDTVVDVLRDRVQRTPQSHAFFVIGADRRWQAVSWATYGERVERLAASLASLGVLRGDRIGICARTSLYWEITEMAALRLGACVVGLDVNYPQDLLAEFIVQLNIVVFIGQDGPTIARFPESVRRRFKLLLTIEPTSAQSRSTRSVNDLLCARVAHSQALSAPRPNDEALVVFSSGTTGTPKPVCYRHDQLSLALFSILDAFDDVDEGSILVCWLPLANLFQRMINFAAMARGATSYVVEDPHSVMDYFCIANPHVFIGVPRFFEKVYAGATKRIEASRGFSSMVARWAITIGQRHARALRSGSDPSLLVRLIWPTADRQVLRKIRSSFGANLRYFICGSAPMPCWLLEWFEGIGLPVLEAYGVSEDIVPIATNRYSARKLGTVGRPLLAHQVNLAEDGEILVRGPGVALKEGSSDAERAEGRQDRFLATGDLGEFDTEGFLRIIGRKTDIFKTAGGKWVSPTAIEGRLYQLPYVEHAAVFGAGRKAIVALIGVNTTYLSESMQPREEGKKQRNPNYADNGALRRQLSDDVANVLNDSLTYQFPAGLLVVAAETFSIAGGELTTNLKIRRDHVAKRFAAAIDRLYVAIDQTPSARPEKLSVVTVDLANHRS